MKCKYCGKEYSSKGIGTHIWRAHGEGQEFNPNTSNKKPWNLGLTKNTDIRVKRGSEKLLGKDPFIKGKIHSDESKKKMSLSAKKAFDKGIHANWKSRNIRSYPELYFDEVLKELNIFSKCQIEYPIKNGKYQYFLDFYFPEKNINLEIDGNQHRLNDRIISDKRRDSFLESIGIKVFRIKWRSPKEKDGKQYLVNKISDFLDFYENAEVV